MFVEKLSKQFGVSCIKKDNEGVCPFPSNKGSGYLKSSIFPNGIEIIEINGILTSPLDVPVSTEKKFLLRMIFNMRWAAKYIDSRGEEHGLNQFDSILNTQKKQQKCWYKFNTAKPVYLFIVELDVENLRKKFIDIDFEDDSDIINLLNGFQKRNFFFSKDNYTLSLHDLILKFNKTSYVGKMRYVYKEAKATEIIIERFYQLLDDLQGNEKRSIQRQATLRSVEEAAIYISDELDDLGTIKEIARSVGLSQQILQQGFKQQFGYTVNQFVADLRLNRAIELLDNSELNMSEITYKLGLSSKSYFSKIFKKKFGMAPNEYKKLLKTNRNREFKRSG